MPLDERSSSTAVLEPVETMKEVAPDTTLTPTF
jgi:hypothetical protein